MLEDLLYCPDNPDGNLVKMFEDYAYLDDAELLERILYHLIL